MTTAVERIEQSRARLRAAMSPPPETPDDAGAARSESWLHKLGALPLVNAVVESVGTWWTQHPLRPVGQMAGEASTALIKPIAQRNPLALVLVAALVGAGLAWSRPWRWIFRSALFAGLVPQLASRVAANLPIESWMSMVGSALSADRARPAASRRDGIPEPAAT